MIPFVVNEVAPVPPCATLSAVVKPLKLVMSLLAPLAAALRLVRAVAASVAPVPPLATGILVTVPRTPPAVFVTMPAVFKPPIVIPPLKTPLPVTSNSACGLMFPMLTRPSARTFIPVVAPLLLVTRNAY